MTHFKDLGLHPQVLKAVTHQGYETPTPIQQQAVPHLLQRKDLLGIAQTGTGKTAAFALPTLSHLVADSKPPKSKRPRVLVLAPTRELAGQISESFRSYAQFTDCGVQTVFGGVKIGRQIRDLQKGTHILVATPGRLVDLMSQGAVHLDAIEILILDEADQMLDMGFIHDLTKIVAQVPKARQTLLFSATMPKQIEDLAQRYLRDPLRVSVTPESTTAERVDQGVLHVKTGDKLRLLQAVLRDPAMERTLVFTRTKHGADKVVRKLMATGVAAQAIHGNKSQPQRLKALQAFRDGRCRVLIATDIAARGIDIDGITHVINFEMPNVSEQYVHRIGRTARAGRTGVAVSFVAEDELYYLRDIEKITRIEVAPLAPPEGCEDIVLPVPSRDMRVRRPKGPSRNVRGGRGNPRGATRPHGGSKAGGQPPRRRKRKSPRTAKPVDA